MANLQLALVVKAVDQATAPLRQIGRAVQRVNRETGLDRVALAAGRVGRQLGRVGAEAAVFARRTGLAALAAGASTVGLAGRFANAGDNIAKTADRLGLGVVELQRWRYAAERSGVSAQTFDMAVQRFGRRAAEAAAGTGEAKDALAYLGIQLRDTNGNMRPTEALMGDVADALSKIEDPLLRNRIAFKLFDSEGVDVGRMLAQGRDQMQEYGDEAERLGIITEEQARAAERYKDEMAATRRALSFLGHTIGAELLPFLKPLIRDIREFAVEARPEVAEQVRNAMADLGHMVRSVASAWKALRERGEGWLASLQETFPAIREWVAAGREWLQEMGLLRLGIAAVSVALGFRLIRAVFGLFGPLARLGGAIIVAGARMLWLAAVGVVKLAGALRQLWFHGLPLVQDGFRRLARALRGLPGLFGRAGRALGRFVKRAAQATFAAFVASIKGAASAMRALNRVIRANPVGLVLTALAGAALLIYEYWDDIVAFFEALWQDVKAAIRVDEWIAWLEGFSLYKTLTGWLTGVVGWFQMRWREIRAAFDFEGLQAWLATIDLWDVVTAPVRGVVAYYSAIWRGIQAVFDFTGLTGWLSQFSLVQTMTGWWGSVVADFQAAWEKVESVFSFENIKKGWQEFKAWLRNIVGEITSILPSWLGGPDEDEEDAPGSRGPSIFDPPGPPGAPGLVPAGAAPVRVGGEVRIRIDQEGRATVKELRSDNRDIDLAVDSDFAMASP